MSAAASRWLVEELRRVREREGLTQEGFASRIHFSAQHVSNVESGTRPATRDYLKAVDKAFRTNLVSFYRQFVVEEEAPVWLRPWLEYEERAVAIRTYEPLVIPGLLQTEEYARMFLSSGPLSPAEVERQVQARMGRQVILDREPLVRISAIFDEGVLRRGDRNVMPAQLERLVELAERPNVTLRVIPADAPPHLGWDGAFTIGSLDEEGDVGYLETCVGGSPVTDPRKVATMVAAWDSVCAVALPARQSLQLIKEVIKTWTI